MKKVNEVKKRVISRSDINSFFDGLDISIFLNLSPFISIYLFEDFVDLNLSIILITSLIFLSFTVRFFSGIVFEYFDNFKHNIYKFFCIYLIVSYGLMLLLPGSSLFLGFMFICLNRILVGYNNTIFFSPLLENNSRTMSQFFNVKLWLFFLTGILIGLSFCKILNQIYSNAQLINGFWKVGIIPLIIFILVKFLFDKNNRQINDFLNSENKIFKYDFGFNDLKDFFNSISLLLPLIIFLLFITNSWLSSFVIPENKQLSEISYVNIILIVLVFICSNFIFRLFKRFLPFNVVNISAILVFLTLFLVSNNVTSYSLDLLKFTISVFSGLSLAIFNLDAKINSNSFNNSYTRTLNILFLILSLIMPIIIYYLLFNSIHYQNIYLILLVLYMIIISVHFLSNKLKKSD